MIFKNFLSLTPDYNHPSNQIMKKIAFIFSIIFTISTLTLCAQEDPESDLRDFENEDIEMRAKSIDFASENSQVSDMISRSKVELQELKRRNATLNKELDIIQNANEALISMNNRLSDQNAALLEEVELLMKSDSEDAQEDIKKNESNIQKNQTKIEGNNETIEENELAIKKYQALIDANEDSVEEIEESIKEYQTMVESDRNFMHLKGRN